MTRTEALLIGTSPDKILHDILNEIAAGPISENLAVPEADHAGEPSP